MNMAPSNSDPPRIYPQQKSKRQIFIDACCQQKVDARIRGVNENYGTGVGRGMRDACIAGTATGTTAGAFLGFAFDVEGAALGATVGGIGGCASGVLVGTAFATTLAINDKNKDLADAKIVTAQDTKECEELANVAGL
jgi:hypothetical protein